MPDSVLEALAALLRHPDDEHAVNVERCARAVEAAFPEGTALLAEFRRRTGALATEGLQELFARTFDLDPICAPEIGWHLFGERYERGLFLVKLKQLRRRLGLPDQVELPDHLAGVLELLGRMEPEEAAELAWACVLPALEKMRGGLAGKDSPYASLLELVARLLEERHPLPPDEEEPPLRPPLHTVDERSGA